VPPSSLTSSQGRSTCGTLSGTMSGTAKLCQRRAYTSLIINAVVCHWASQVKHSSLPDGGACLVVLAFSHYGIQTGMDAYTRQRTWRCVYCLTCTLPFLCASLFYRNDHKIRGKRPMDSSESQGMVRTSTCFVSLSDTHCLQTR
jgi:hypothetical protein